MVIGAATKHDRVTSITIAVSIPLGIVAIVLAIRTGHY
jgi:hypothetical protein